MRKQSVTKSKPSICVRRTMILPILAVEQPHWFTSERIRRNGLGEPLGPKLDAGDSALATESALTLLQGLLFGAGAGGIAGLEGDDVLAEARVGGGKSFDQGWGRVDELKDVVRALVLVTLPGGPEGVGPAHLIG